MALPGGNQPGGGTVCRRERLFSLSLRSALLTLCLLAVAFRNGGDVFAQGVDLDFGVVSRPVVVHTRSPAPLPSRFVVTHLEGLREFEPTSRPVSLRVIPPDLRITSFRFDPIEGFIGDSVEVSWTVTNVGKAAALGPWVDRLSRSLDDNVGLDTVALEVPGRDRLEPGESYSRSETVSVFTNPAVFWLVLQIDAERELREVTTVGDNTRVSDEPFRRQPRFTGNLKVSAIAAPSGPVLSGGTVEVTYSVRNDSINGTDASFWRDSVFLVEAEDLASDLRAEPYLLGQFLNPHALGPGGSYEETVDVRIPERVAGGFRLAVYADSRRPGAGAWSKGGVFDLVEDDETENFGFSDSFIVEVGASQPDLSVAPESIAFLPDGLSGALFRVRWSVGNVGTASTRQGVWKGAVYLSRNSDPTLGPEDIQLGEVIRRGDPLPAEGVDAERELLVALPPEFEGAFFVKVVTDTADEIWEARGGEDNNVAVSPRVLSIIRSLAVDLVAADVRVPSTVVPGGFLEFAWDVVNAGAPPQAFAFRWSDAIYLSDDLTIDPETDLLLGRFGRGTVTALGALSLADYTRTGTARLPADLPLGDYFVLVSVDSEAQVFEGLGEASEANNLASSTLVRVLAPAADLVLETAVEPLPAPPSSAAAGDAILLAWQVRNGGRTSVPRTLWRDRVVLSEDDVLGDDDLVLVTRARSESLPARGKYSREELVDVPSVVPGDYFLVFATDFDGRVFEGGADPEPEANNFKAVPFRVTDAGADLAVILVEAPSDVVSGAELTVSWMVENRGSRETRATAWVDRVYLSPVEALGPDAVAIGSRLRTTSLGIGESYSVGLVTSVPLVLAGPFFVLVETDAAAEVAEVFEENNFQRASVPLVVEPAAAANLVVSSVAAPSPAVAGQQLCVSWTVTNAGGGATSALAWRDGVFLSRDQFLSRERDFFLGQVEREGVLASRENYSVPEACFDLPTGLSGPYFVVVSSDLEGLVFEGDLLEDSRAFSLDPIEVSIPPPSDLVVTEVTGPVGGGGELGEALAVSWSIQNQGGAPVEGRFFTTFFLSSDVEWDLEDAVLGRFPTELESRLDAGGEATFSAIARVPGVLPGSYHLIARADVFQQIPETAEDNNTSASNARVDLSVPTLDLDAPPRTDALAGGEERFYAVEGVAGETLRIAAIHANPLAWLELYARFEALPTSGNFDVRFDAPGQSSQSLKIPDARTGTYFILVRAAAGTTDSGATSVDVEAVTIPFSVESVTPSRMGDRGRVTLTLEGSRFESGVEVSLEGAGGEVLTAREVIVADGGRLKARFALAGVPRGTYGVVAAFAGGVRATLPDAVEIVAAEPALIAVEAAPPPSLRRGTSGGTWVWEIVNRGNVDADYVFLLQSVAERDGREVLEVASPDARAAVLGAAGGQPGEFAFPNLFARSLAPGERASLATTLRAGIGEASGATLGQGVALLTTEEFLGFAADAGEAVRKAVLADPELIALEEQGEVLAAAQTLETWQVRWFADLERSGWVGARDVIEFLGAPSRQDGHVACRLRQDADGVPNACTELVARFCESWLQHVVELGVESAGVFAHPPDPEALSSLVCSLDDFVACTSCAVWPVTNADDPNEKEGPSGTGDDELIPIQQDVCYRIHFENMASASAPAAVVTVRDPLESNLDPTSFRLGDICFGDVIVEVGDESFSLQESVDLSDSLGVTVSVLAGLDARTNEAFWILRSIDPLTGETPTAGDVGFLPPEDGSGVGQGWVEFRVRARGEISVEPVIEIENDAGIVFDEEAPLRTFPVLNDVDPVAPTSAVNPLPPVSTAPSILLTWGGEDAEGGSGLAAVSVFVAEDDGPFLPFLINTRATSGVFDQARPGHNYSFYTLASDNSGNLEAAPEFADTMTRAVGESFFRRADADADGSAGLNDAVVLLNFLFLGGEAPMCSDAADCDDDGELSITDGLCVLNFLFAGGVEPSTPGPDFCGPDPTADELVPCVYPEGSCSPF